MRGEAPALASDVGNLMQIHQGEHHGVEDSEHLRHRWEADAALILAQGHIAAPVESIFHGPMLANELQEPLGATLLWQQTGPAVDHLDAVLVFDGAFAGPRERPVPPRPTRGAGSRFRSGLVVMWRRSRRP